MRGSSEPAAILAAGVLGAVANLLRGNPGELREFLGFAVVGGMDGLVLGAVVFAIASRTSAATKPVPAKIQA